jgi:hypothetical protein
MPNLNGPVVFNAATPPSTGQPGRRSDAGSRGCGEGEPANSMESSLLALVPVVKAGKAAIVYGKTAAAHPTVWFYSPVRPGVTAQFVLQDDSGNSLYQTTVALPKTGIVAVPLPSTLPPLVTGQRYRWFFKRYCRTASPPESFVDGWIERQAPAPNLSQTLQTASPAQQVRLYAAQGFWFDALTAAAELRHRNPNDRDWAKLLRAIDLESVADLAISE